MIALEVFMDIFALRRQGFSMRCIATKLGIHRNTVAKYVKTSLPLQYRKSKRRESILTPYQQTIDDYLEKDNYQATWIFDRLSKMGYSGSYDTVKHYVRNVKERLRRLAYIRFESEPGVQAQMDWGDFQIQEPSGLTTTVHAFVLVLGFSRAMFVEFVRRCSLETFMDCHIHAFRYLQGVPAEILYDNMRNVVISRKKGPASFNTEFAHFAHHYGFYPIACPPYSPWVKGKVERPIDYLRERFWRGYPFQSLEKANQDVLCWLQESANERVHGTHHQVVRIRWEEEIPALGKRPDTDYDTSLKVFRKVYKDCQISYNCNRYVLPHHVVGKRVMLKIKDGAIRFYHDQELLATYREPEGKHHTLSNPFFYDALKRDREQLKGKYLGTKGKATRGLITATLFPEVAHRPLSEYEPFSQGGESWNN